MHKTFLELDKQLYVNSSLIEEINLYVSKTDNLTNQVSILTDKSTIMKTISEEQKDQVISLEGILVSKDKKIRLLKKSRNIYIVLGIAAGAIAYRLISNR